MCIFTAMYSQNLSDSLISVVKKKSLSELKTFFEQKKSVIHDRVLDRQVVDTYFEYSFGVRNVPGYKINLLCDGNKIIYAKVLSANKKKFEEQDSAAVKQFYKSYTAFFSAKVKISDFFVDTIVYGRGCGIVGTDPASRKKMAALVAAKNTKELTKWLQNANTEKQLYGVEGFLDLEKKGYKLDALQKKLIDFITTKKGEAKTCNSSLFENKKISSIFNVKGN